MQQQRPRLLDTVLSPLQTFLRQETAGGVVLLICTAAALLWVNSPWHESYHHFWENNFTIGINGKVFTQPLHFWINDGLMAIFFFVVGLEVKRESLTGELSSFKKAALPVFGALGGMVMPALIFLLCAGRTEYVPAWGVPIATDIAFALGICRLLGSRVPFGLYVFLAALAIADDIGAVIVIALFYSGQLDVGSIAVMAGLLTSLVILNRMGVRSLLVYAVFGVALWYATYLSGIHATLSGVLLALCIPARESLAMDEFIAQGRDKLTRLENHSQSDAHHEGDFQAQQSIVHALEENCERVMTPLERIEATLHAWVSFGIMPLFALANAGIALSSESLQSVSNPLFYGIVLGLVAGKPIGIFLFSWLATKLKWASLPEGVSYGALAGVACLGGIGFTMSIFIAGLALEGEGTLQIAKFGILTASMLASLLGTALMLTLTKARSKQMEEV